LRIGRCGEPQLRCRNGGCFWCSSLLCWALRMAAFARLTFRQSKTQSRGCGSAHGLHAPGSSQPRSSSRKHFTWSRSERQSSSKQGGIKSPLQPSQKHPWSFTAMLADTQKSPRFGWVEKSGGVDHVMMVWFTYLGRYLSQLSSFRSKFVTPTAYSKCGSGILWILLFISVLKIGVNRRRRKHETRFCM
jgi:hypothetical protein